MRQEQPGREAGLQTAPTELRLPVELGLCSRCRQLYSTVSTETEHSPAPRPAPRPAHSVSTPDLSGRRVESAGPGRKTWSAPCNPFTPPAPATVPAPPSAPTEPRYEPSLLGGAGRRGSSRRGYLLELEQQMEDTRRRKAEEERQREVV